MAEFLTIHHENPQGRMINQVVALLRRSGVIAYPTDSCYALGCYIGDKAAQDRIRQIRNVPANHNFTLVCRDLSEISNYAKIDNTAYRLMKSLTPGPYTFILRATHEVPRRLQNPKRKSIGLRVPENSIAMAILDALGEPLMSSTLQLPDDELPLADPADILEQLDKQVDLVVDGGHCGIEPTTVIDLTEGAPSLIRQGRGDTSMLDI